PFGLSATDASTPSVTPIDLLDSINQLFDESGSITGQYAVIQTKQALHAPGPLHATDPNPIHLYATSGDISGLTLFSGKSARVVAGQDLTDLSLYIQNDNATNLTVVAAGRDLIAYDPNSSLRTAAQATGNELLPSNSTTPGPASGNPDAGDIQISGPGTLEVLAGRNLDLGVGVGGGDGTGVGITSIGNARNPYLPFTGADIIAGAGLGVASSLAASPLDFAAFETEFLNPSTAGGSAVLYLPDLAALMGLSNTSLNGTWAAFNQLSADQRDQLALQIFYLVLRDSGRNHSVATSAGFGNYNAGFAAISALFPKPAASGDISLTSREIETASGGNIELLAPAGGVTVGFNVAGAQAVDQGILTEDGGNISIFTKDSAIVGTSRIFTLRGGNEIIWSSTGDIAAGASSKTVQSAPPTRVLIDPQSGDVKTDLAGLATGGGIGVLETVAGVAPGDVDLIAPVGAVNAGDAGIRVSGNLNISAVTVLNSSNVQVGGTSVGTPATVATSLAGALSAASSVSAAGNAAVDTVTRPAKPQDQAPEPDSLITVEVL
ncbi:MAG TPA: filamentous hemagglutinin family protein, partial [Rhodopila sp.]